VVLDGSAELSSRASPPKRGFRGLIDDPTQRYQYWGGDVSNDGGQHFKKIKNADGSIKSTPFNVDDLLNDADGEAWMVTRRSAVEVTGPYVFFYADIEPGYRKFHTDAPRASVLEVKYMLINPTPTNGLKQTALLYYARVKKTNPAWRVLIPWHARSVTAGGVNQPLVANFTGYGTEKGLSGAGKVWGIFRPDDGQQVRVVPMGPRADATQYGKNQFKIFGEGVNYLPERRTAERNDPDLKKDTLYFESTTQREEERFVALFTPNVVPEFDWIDEPNFFGVALGADRSQKYHIGKTTVEASYTGGGPTSATTTTPPQTTAPTTTQPSTSVATTTQPSTSVATTTVPQTSVPTTTQPITVPPENVDLLWTMPQTLDLPAWVRKLREDNPGLNVPEL
jgi:hypothetical protein